MNRQACAGCGGQCDEGARVAGLCVVCRPRQAHAAPEPLPDLVRSVVAIGARLVGDRIKAHPVGLALAAAVYARNEAQAEGRGDDWPAIFERMSALIRENRKDPTP